MNSSTRLILVAIAALALAGCQAHGTSSIQRSALKASPACQELSLPVMLDLDWDGQLHWPDEVNISTGELLHVRARVTKRVYPTFDVGSIGGAEDRLAILHLLDHEVIPGCPNIRKILLRTTTAGVTSDCLSDGEVCTLLFTRDLRLYDVIDPNGHSPMLIATNNELSPEIQDQIFKRSR